MQTKTEVANQALAFLSAGTITNINDNDNELARVVSSVFDSVAKQVIRSHRWSCCTRRATLAQIAGDPVKTSSYGYAYQYQLPSDNLRFLDLNGEPWKNKQKELSIEGSVLYTNDSAAYVRYIAWISNTEEWDVLLAEAVAIKIGSRIARRITKDGMSGEQFEGLYQKAIANAQFVDAMEVGSGENSPLNRMLESSPLVNAGRGFGGTFRPVNRIGLEVDYSV